MIFIILILISLVGCNSENPSSRAHVQKEEKPTPPKKSLTLVLESPESSPGNDSTPTLRVSGFEEEATVTLYSDSSCDTRVSNTVQVARGESSVSLTSNALEEGTATFYAAGRDRAGNKSACSMGVSYVLDITAPTAPGTPALEEPNTSQGTDPTPTLRVSGVEGEATVTLYSDSSCDTRVSDSVQVTRGESFVSIVSYSLEEGTATFYAAERDRAGNKSACSTGVSYVFDVTAPATPAVPTLEEPNTSPGTDPTPTINLSGVEGEATVTLYSDSSCDTQASDSVQVARGENSVSIASYSLEEGMATFYAAQRDRAGNKSACSTGLSYVLDVTAPIAPDTPVLEEPSTSPGTDPTPTLRVSGVEGEARVTLYSDSSCDTQASDSIQVARGESSVSIVSYSLEEGMATFYAAGRDRAGNKSACSMGVSYILDVTAPTPPRALALEEPSTSPGIDPTPTVRVSGVEGGATVTLYSDPSCDIQVSDGIEVLSDESAVSITSRSLGDGSQDVEVSFYAVQRDRAGHESLCSSATVSYVADLTLPAPPTGLSLSDPVSSPSGNAAPVILIEGVEEGARVTLYSDNSCESAVSSTQTVPQAKTDILMTSHDLGNSDATVDYYAAQEDIFGRSSPCSTLSASYGFIYGLPYISEVSVETGSYFYDDPSHDHLEIRVHFSENVNVGGTPRLELSIGEITKYARYMSGTGSSTLVFNYDISSDDYDSDGIQMSATLDLNGATIRDSTNKDASLRFISPQNLGRVWINFEETLHLIDGAVAGFVFIKRGGEAIVRGLVTRGSNFGAALPSLREGVKEIISTSSAIAALKDDGSVVVWGRTSFGEYGADPREVSSQLQGGVKQVVSSSAAFAALKEDGSVIAWGDHNQGGEINSVSRDLGEGVKEIFSNTFAFAALKDDGSVIAWGRSDRGGNLGGVSLDLQSEVVKIFSTSHAFAALKENGSVVTWGWDGGGGNSHSVSSDLREGVVEILSNNSVFAALKNDGSVVTWGSEEEGGDQGDASADLREEVEEVFFHSSAFVALKKDGSVVTWGDIDRGGDSRAVSSDLREGVVNIFSVTNAFAALKENGSVLTWGWAEEGGDSHSVSSDLRGGVVNIFSTDYAFAALKENGSVITWGYDRFGGDSRSVSSDLREGVIAIYSNEIAFAALKENGSVVTWGDTDAGGNSSGVSSHLREGVIEIFASEFAFAALKEDGSVIIWGSARYGGSPEGVLIEPRW